MICRERGNSGFLMSGDFWEGFHPDPVFTQSMQSLRGSKIPYKSIFTIKTVILLLLVHRAYEKQAKGALRGSGEFEHNHTSP